MDLAARVKQLEDAIRNHRDQKGDARCWLDDLELYAVLNDSVVPDVSLPPKDHFLGSCSRYWENRQCPDDRKWQNTMPWPEWSELLREASYFASNHELHSTYDWPIHEKWTALRDRLANAVVELDKYKPVAELTWDESYPPFVAGDKVFGWRKND